MDIVFAGCGALGSQLAMIMADINYRFVLFDYDRVEPGNEENSAFVSTDHGQLKAFALANHMWAKCGVSANPITKRIDDSMLRSKVFECDLIIDTLDEVEVKSKLYGDNVVHLGMSPNRVGMVKWNEFPFDESGDGGDLCTRAIGRGIAAMTVAVGYNAIVHWIETGEHRDFLVGESWVKLQS